MFNSSALIGTFNWIIKTFAKRIYLAFVEAIICHVFVYAIQSCVAYLSISKKSYTHEPFVVSNKKNISKSIVKFCSVRMTLVSELFLLLLLLLLG